jgi:hypothetical protein
MTDIPIGDTSDWGVETRIIEPGIFNEAGEQINEPETEDIEEPEVEEEVVENEVVEEPQINIEDPGDFEPKDYSFEVTVYNKEGGNGRSIKITDLEQWDKLLDEDPNFGTATQLLKAERQATRMQTQQERDIADYNARIEEYNKQVESTTAREETLDNLVNEMVYLENRGDMPKVPAKFRNDWNSSDAKKDPAIKQQQELLSYMTKHNAELIKAGLKPTSSLIDAYAAWQNDIAKKEIEDDKKNQGQARRAAGARVSAPSTNAGTTAPRGIAVGRVGSLDQLGMNDWSH